VDDASCYDILGIDPSAGPDEIRAAYRRVASRVHPDAGGTDALFRQARQAYETLSDPVRRAAHDEAFRSDSGQPSSDPAPGWTRVDQQAADARPPPPDAGPPWPGASTGAPVLRSSWFATHPSSVVTLSGALATWLGFVAVDGLAALGVLAVVLGTVGMVGSGRARSDEVSTWQVAPSSGPRRFGSDLRFGIPMVCRFVLVTIVVLVLRSEFRRATGGGRR